jgi:SAM-dependent methyltransferase
MDNLQKNTDNSANAAGGRPLVLDVCCGSRMFWFDRKDDRAIFIDRRSERHALKDISSKGGSRELAIIPDCQADFMALPFRDNTFTLVVFDPPHFQRNGSTGWIGLKYGTLKGDWQEVLAGGFSECFRVLRPEGVLILKWCADEISVSRILALAPGRRPLFGHKSGRQQKTHWITFMKPKEHEDGGRDQYAIEAESLGDGWRHARPKG